MNQEVLEQRNLLNTGLRKRLLNMKTYFTNSLKQNYGGAYIELRYLHGGVSREVYGNDLQDIGNNYIQRSVKTFKVVFACCGGNQ